MAAKIAERLQDLPADLTILDVATGPGFLLLELGQLLDRARMLAHAIRLVIRLTAGKEMAKGFWKSFSAGLRGTDVRDLLLELGLADVGYLTDGCN